MNACPWGSNWKAWVQSCEHSQNFECNKILEIMNKTKTNLIWLHAFSWINLHAKYAPLLTSIVHGDGPLVFYHTLQLAKSCKLDASSNILTN